jgi:hypothetical protein
LRRVVRGDGDEREDDTDVSVENRPGSKRTRRGTETKGCQLGWQGQNSCYSVGWWCPEGKIQAPKEGDGGGKTNIPTSELACD